MPRDAEMQHTPAIVADDEETAENTKCKGWDGEEVHRRDHFTMVTQEGEPTFGSLGISRGSSHPTGDRSLGDVKTQHQQLAVDTRRAPGGILAHYPKDEIPHFLRNPFSADHPGTLEMALRCVKTVPKLYLFSALGIALSEKQIPQVVENSEN
jgi:hypothetical protein